MKKRAMILGIVVLLGALAVGWYVYQPSEPWWSDVPLYDDGLRVRPSGVDDASRVVDPSQFRDRRIQRAYRIARRIPGTLNKLYCWCGCQEGENPMRSNLECFESVHAARCGICIGTAEVAWTMVSTGRNDPGRIQSEVDRRFAPDGAL